MKTKDHEILTTKSTPLYTTDWYIKWVSTVILLCGMILTAQNIFPLNLYVSIAGLAGWLGVSIMWNDRALIIINAVGIFIYANGTIAYLMQ